MSSAPPDFTQTPANRKAAASVGRIGTLAATLGVGAAVAFGTGVAWADTAESSGPDSSQQATAGPSKTGTPAAGRATRGAATRGAAAGVARTDASASKAPRTSSSSRTAAASATAVKLPAGLSAAIDDAPTAKNPAPLPAAAVTVAVPKPAAVPTASAAVPVSDPVVPLPTVQPAAVATAVADTLSEPVAAAVPVAAAPKPVPARAMRASSRLLAAVGLDPASAATTTDNPADAAALWALLAYSRGQIGRVGSRASAAPTAAVSGTLTTTPTNLGSAPLGWVTGQSNTAYPGWNWTQTNNTNWANVYGTDLGIMWFNGDNGLTQLAFGDTFSGRNMTGDWRSNVLLLSDDTELYDGLSLINTGPAYQFIPAARNQVFFIGSEVTNIPTSAVYADATNYVSYMSVKSWDTPGRWTTNYSAVSEYDPVTDKWVLQTSTVRSAGWFRSSTRYRAGDQNFQQMAYVLEPESKVAPGETRYIYAFGTPSGRAGSAFLSRVPEGAITDLSQYDYWDGTTWVRDNPAVAAPVLGDSPNSAGLFGCIVDLANNPNFFGGWFAGLTGAKTGGNVSEMSIQYNEYLDKYVVLYGNGLNNVILRTADTPEGPWSDPVTIATSLQYPGLYAPMIHPLSGTGDLTDANGDPDVANLYWNMSIWSNYNVVLMQTDLSSMQTTLV
ncbi:MAG: DUF4185 domain-containing protein [Mycobacterium sp.]